MHRWLRQVATHTKNGRKCSPPLNAHFWSYGTTCHSAKSICLGGANPPPSRSDGNRLQTSQAQRFPTRAGVAAESTKELVNQLFPRESTTNQKKKTRHPFVSDETGRRSGAIIVSNKKTQRAGGDLKRLRSILFAPFRGCASTALSGLGLRKRAGKAWCPENKAGKESSKRRSFLLPANSPGAPRRSWHRQLAYANGAAAVRVRVNQR